MRTEEIPLKIIYLLSPSHSGSTLLSLLLGSQKGICCVGELDIFSQQPNCKENLLTKKCGCERVTWKDCRFWSLVNDELTINHQIKLNELDLDSSDETVFFNHNYWLLKTISKLSNSHVIVDPSKNLPRMQRLMAAGFDVLPIRLQRNPMAVVNSWLSRNHQWDEKDKGHNWWEVATYYNSFYKEVDRFLLNKRHVKVSYESLVLETKKDIDGIVSEIGVETKPVVIDWGEKTHHHLSGNPMRYSKKGIITLDKRWEQNLTNFQKRSIQYLTWPSMSGNMSLYKIWKLPNSLFHRSRKIMNWT